VPFGFLKRRKPEDGSAEAADAPGGASSGGTTPGGTAEPAGDGRPGSASSGNARMHDGGVRGVPFTAITEDWRLRGRMEIAGRLTDALNKREAIAISDVSWGPSDGSTPMTPAPGIRSVDPYDLILVIAGEDSLPPLTETERSALKVHKVPYEVALEVPPFRIAGTVYLHPGYEPERLLDRSNEMFTPVVGAVARLDEVEVTDPEIEVILINRFYLRGVEQVDHRAPRTQAPGAAGAG